MYETIDKTIVEIWEDNYGQNKETKNDLMACKIRNISRHQYNQNNYNSVVGMVGKNL